MNRRSLLAGLGAMGMGMLLGSCRQRNQATLMAAILENAVPPQLLTTFGKRLESGITLQVESKAQLADLFEQLQTWHTQEQPIGDRPSLGVSPANVVALGDYWLQPAIQQELIQPINSASWRGWDSLEPRWQQLVTRDRQGYLSESGDVWAAPYRSGHLMIAYRKPEFEKLGWQPQDWVDLWRPDIQRHISLLDSARVVIGIALKMLGHGFNEPNPSAIADLQPSLETLNQQVKTYSSEAYLQPLLIGDTWLAVGWSTDILPVLERNKNLVGIVPASGTLLSTDLWVVPKEADSATPGSADPVQQWVEFYWQVVTAEQLSTLSPGVSPVLMNRDRITLSPALQANDLLLPSEEILCQSELLHPLSPEAIAQYKALWTKTRVAVPLIRE